MITDALHSGGGKQGATNGRGSALILRKRMPYVLADLTWGISTVGMLLIVGPGLLTHSPLGRSVLGKWSIGIILAFAVIGVIAAVHRKLRPAGFTLSEQGLTVQGQAGQRTLPWNNLTAVAVRNRTTMKKGVIQTTELRFACESPIYLDDEFTLRREQLVKTIQEYANLSGVVFAFTADDRVAEARFRHTGLIAIGVYILSITLVIAMVVGLAWKTRHIP